MKSYLRLSPPALRAEAGPLAAGSCRFVTAEHQHGTGFRRFAFLPSLLVSWNRCMVRVEAAADCWAVAEWIQYPTRDAADRTDGSTARSACHDRKVTEGHH